MEAAHFKKHKGQIKCVKADGKRCKTAIGNGKYKVKDHVTIIEEPSGNLNEYNIFLNSMKKFLNCIFKGIIFHI